jgi:hypothetical protein
MENTKTEPLTFSELCELCEARVACLAVKPDNRDLEWRAR